MCVSYMLGRHGCLLVNRQIFSRDVEDFEYSPSVEFQAPFRVLNFTGERALL